MGRPLSVLHSWSGSALLLAVSLTSLAAGGLLWAADVRRVADVLWMATTAAALIPSLLDAAKRLARRQLGVDLIAILAMAGALAYGEYLAGAVIALMLATGRALERYAIGRAERDLTALLERAPRVAHRIEDGHVVTVPAEEVRPGDRLAVREADLLPVDGVVVDSAAVLDESTLTGESRLVTREAGDRVSSGTLNAGPVFQMIASARAADSTYAGIVRLVQEARASRAPFVRLADRYAGLFVPITLVVALVAWVSSDDPVRALAVLVVATPCPLLLGAPIAIVAGLSRCARHGVIVKGGAALEALGRTQTVLLDKTGTLTLGQARLQRVLLARTWRDEDEALRLAASLDQASSHVIAAALSGAARDRGLSLTMPGKTHEVPGEGIAGTIDDHHLIAGRPSWVFAQSAEPDRALIRGVQRHAGTAVALAVDGTAVAAFLLDDPIRPDSPRTLRALRASGIREIVMVTGDHASVAASIAASLGIDRVLAERGPEEKLAIVREWRGVGVTAMVGDGINDAPALAAADIGVAMGARGATSSSEAADVVLVQDRLEGLVYALNTARRSRRIALQSVFVGMGASFVAMGFAAFGHLPPVAGALVQEGIDVAAIGIALRALVPERRQRAIPAISDELAEQLRREHLELIPELERFRRLGELLPDLPPGEADTELREVVRVYQQVLLPHERADESDVYPALGRALAGSEVLAALSLSHAEIFHLGRQLEALVGTLPEDGPTPEDLPDLYRVLYAMHAVLSLHFAQEEELYSALHDHYLELGTTSASVSEADLAQHHHSVGR